MFLDRETIPREDEYDRTNDEENDVRVFLEIEKSSGLKLLDV